MFPIINFKKARRTETSVWIPASCHTALEQQQTKPICSPHYAADGEPWPPHPPPALTMRGKQVCDKDGLSLLNILWECRDPVTLFPSSASSEMKRNFRAAECNAQRIWFLNFLCLLKVFKTPLHKDNGIFYQKCIAADNGKALSIQPLLLSDSPLQSLR